MSISIGLYRDVDSGALYDVIGICQIEDDSKENFVVYQVMSDCKQPMLGRKAQDFEKKISERKFVYTNKRLKIGVDNGGVCSKHASQVDTEGHVAHEELNMPGAIKGLHLLKDSGGHELFLESFSGRTRAIQTMEVINKLEPNLFTLFHFTKDKKYKADICEHLGLDVMIDDSYDVVENVAKQNPSMLVIWFQGDPSFDKTQKVVIPFLPNIVVAQSWTQVVEICDKESKLYPTRKSKHPNVVSQRVGFLHDEKQWNKRVYLLHNNNNQ